MFDSTICMLFVDKSTAVLLTKKPKQSYWHADACQAFQWLDTLDNCVPLPFDLLTSSVLAECLPWAISLMTLMLIAQAVLLMEAWTDRHTVTDASDYPTHKMLPAWVTVHLLLTHVAYLLLHIIFCYWVVLQWLFYIVFNLIVLSMMICHANTEKVSRTALCSCAMLTFNALK